MLKSDVSRETLNRYAALLLTWNKRLNLVSKRDVGEGFEHRHFDDSLSLLPHLPATAGRFVDLGSGGGLPAIPLASVTGQHADMVEADRRKAAFLQTALATLSLKGSVWCERVEVTSVPPAMCLTARAFAPLASLLAVAARLLAEGGTALFLKGPRAEEEIELALKDWQMTVELLPGVSSRSRIMKINDLKRLTHGLG